jgi:hypothetical protein
VYSVQVPWALGVLTLGHKKIKHPTRGSRVGCVESAACVIPNNLILMFFHHFGRVFVWSEMLDLAARPMF